MPPKVTQFGSAIQSHLRPAVRGGITVLHWLSVSISDSGPSSYCSPNSSQPSSKMFQPYLRWSFRQPSVMAFRQLNPNCSLLKLNFLTGFPLYSRVSLG